MINLLLKPRKTAKTLIHKMLCLSFLFLFCVNDTHSFMAIVGISFKNLNLLLEVLINQYLLTGLIKFGSSVDEATGPSLTEGTVFREREREREGERMRKKTAV